LHPSFPVFCEWPLVAGLGLFVLAWKLFSIFERHMGTYPEKNYTVSENQKIRFAHNLPNQHKKLFHNCSIIIPKLFHNYSTSFKISLSDFVLSAYPQKYKIAFKPKTYIIYLLPNLYLIIHVFHFYSLLFMLRIYTSVFTFRLFHPHPSR